MRVLWFSINASCYNSALTKGGYNGGGWVSSLEKIIKKQKNIHLGIAFEFESDKFKDSIDGVDYYPINVLKNRKEHLIYEYTIKHEEKYIIPEALKIIEDFKPDIIQCFGAEWCFGLVAQYTDIPIIIHIQGSMPSYNNVAYPPKYNRWTTIVYDLTHFHVKDVMRSILGRNKAKEREDRELRILRMNKYFFGRTVWDKAIVDLLSPGSLYFLGNEALRDSFYYSDIHWTVKNRNKIVLCTTGNGSLWKGLDVILKTAHILKTYTDLEFSWRIIGGVDNVGYLEWMEKLKFHENNVELLGILDEKQIKEELLNCDIYVHPAYIDNSPNALCEAMILGCPCIASYVGGIPSIIEDGVSGELVPVNEPYYLADRIKLLSIDKERQSFLSMNAIKQAKERHDIDNIEKEIMSAYKRILK